MSDPGTPGRPDAGGSATVEADAGDPGVNDAVRGLAAIDLDDIDRVDLATAIRIATDAHAQLQQRLADIGT